MKFLELYLMAFGPFTDINLDFSMECGDFNIIYGPNEAGKSSALRALKSFLFGIKSNSPDDFVHKYDMLRIGGRLLRSDGSQDYFIRRKGNKGTILDKEGRQLDDHIFAEYLSGIDEKLFETSFGIDHNALERGAKEIIQEGGEAGKSLFAARIGGTSLPDIIKEFNSEAGELFLKQGRTKRINLLLNEYAEIKHNIKIISLSGQKWKEQSKVIKKTQLEINGKLEKLQELETDKSRLARIKRVLPLITKRTDILNRIEAMGEVVQLSENFPRTHNEIERSIITAEENKNSAGYDLEMLKKNIQSLNVSPKILDFKDTISKLHKELGSHQKAGEDLSQLKGELHQLNASAESILNHIYPGFTLHEVEKLRLRIDVKARIGKLSQNYYNLQNKLEVVGKEINKTELKLAESEKLLLEIKSYKDISQLSGLVSRIQKEGNLESRLEILNKEITELSYSINIEIKKAGLWKGSLEETESLSVPLPETVDRYEDEFLNLSNSIKSMETAIQESEKEIAEIKQKIESIQSAGYVPGIDDLLGKREVRDKGWQLIVKDWINNEDINAEKILYSPDEELHLFYERSVKNADEIADRMRLDAERVAENESLNIRLKQKSDYLDKVRMSLKELNLKNKELNSEWEGLWGEIDIDPLKPKEMRSWLFNFDRIRNKVANCREHGLEYKNIEKHIKQYLKELKLAAEDIEPDMKYPERGLEILIELCKTLLKDIENSANRKKELINKIRMLKNDLIFYRNEQSGYTEDLKKWKDEWSEIVIPLGLNENSFPEEAGELLNKLDELFKCINSANEKTGRIKGIEKDAEHFYDKVAIFIKQSVPELIGQSAENAVSLLINNISKASKVLELEKQADTKRKVLKQSEDTVNQGREQLNALCRQAKCENTEGLKKAEERSLEYIQLKRELENIESRIIEAGDGIQLDQLIRDAESSDPDLISLKMSELEADIDELKQTSLDLTEKLVREKVEFEKMDGSPEAAVFAEKAGNVLSTIEEEAMRYIKLKIASIILDREIERYRKENQGPVLNRAGEIFSRLTLNSFKGLSTEYKRDEVIITGERNSGDVLNVEQMSDGTVDQLYLSLRLAGLENYLKNNEPVPFIVDDILIKFDDERAKAALDVLAELSQKTQILFFTHNRHLLNLSESIAEKDKINISELG